MLSVHCVLDLCAKKNQSKTPEVPSVAWSGLKVMYNQGVILWFLLEIINLPSLSAGLLKGS